MKTREELAHCAMIGRCSRVVRVPPPMSRGCGCSVEAMIHREECFDWNLVGCACEVQRIEDEARWMMKHGYCTEGL